ncbi:MAG: hypothetical protein V4548_08745 [Bacteroidota bacterium]
MQSNKTELDFKNKLNQREIKPSSQAWDRLDAMLAVAEEKKPARKLPWLYIAASIVVFLCIGIGFYNQNNEGVVIENNDVVIENQPKTEDRAVIKKEMPIKVTSQVKQGIAVNIEEKNKKPTKNRTIEVIINNNQNPITENSIITQKTDQELITPKTTEVAIVEPSIKSEKITVKPSIKVNASSLLSQVDGELDLTFRESALDRLNKNFKTLKTVIVNRNYAE